VRIRFGPFVLDGDTRQLLRDNREIHLAPKAFALLETLASGRPKAFSKAELQQRLWPETFVVEANLSALIAELRHALDDNARTPRFIRTVHAFGYAFCANATVESAPQTAVAAPLYWLEWGRLRFPLPEGEHVVGRDPDVDIRLDASTVSRRHARVIVTADGVVLEDFDSKNGILHRGVRVASPVRLADGDTIHIGSILVTFHVRGELGTTETQRR